jgi:hypothetical protein
MIRWKPSFGTQSAAGSRSVETILTSVETCRRQSRNSFEYLAVACRHFAVGKHRHCCPACERLRLAHNRYKIVEMRSGKSAWY